jgi:hypothetical protein
MIKDVKGKMSHSWLVYGHDWAVEHLRKALANGRVRHAYLIVGLL